MQKTTRERAEKCRTNKKKKVVEVIKIQKVSNSEKIKRRDVNTNTMGNNSIVC